jgi:hypothetical protein
MPQSRDARRKAALIRNHHRDSRTTKDQLVLIGTRRGRSERERTRLFASLTTSIITPAPTDHNQQHTQAKNARRAAALAIQPTHN